MRAASLTRSIAFLLLGLLVGTAWVAWTPLRNIDKLVEGPYLEVGYEAAGKPDSVSALSMNKALRSAEGFWKDRCGLHIRIVPDSDSQFKVRWSSTLPAGTEGFTRSMHAPTGPLGAVMEIDANRTFRSPDHIAATLAHEIGHMLGAKHIEAPEDLMFPYDWKAIPLADYSVSCPSFKLVDTYTRWKRNEKEEG